VAAAETAQLLEALIEQRNSSARDIHLIGHSLGAHTSGYVGKRVKGIGRISGLVIASLIDFRGPIHFIEYPFTREIHGKFISK
jgi:pancreatic triacylglycerol lipase